MQSFSQLACFIERLI